MIKLPAYVQAVPVPSTDRERRAAERFSCRLEAVSCPLDAPETLTWGAMVQDISTGGIGFILCYPFKPGTYLAINLGQNRGREAGPGTLLGRVVHVKDQADGTWLIGCEFVQPLAEEYLNQLI